MIRSRRNESPSRQTESKEKRKRFRFELGTFQLLLYSCGLFLVMAWMFVFGVLVGRGLPLADSNALSLSAQLLRFLGLAEQVKPPPQNVAESWETQKKMLESLDYHQSLAKKSDPSAPKATNPTQATPAQQPPTPAPPAPKAKSPSPPAAQPRPEKPNVQDSDKVTQQNFPAGSERYTLLAASMKEPENAQRMVEQLRAKGYSPRLESIDMPDSGRWNRVLVGSFETREEAQKFAAEFNRKERKQGLVIKIGR